MTHVISACVAGCKLAVSFLLVCLVLRLALKASLIVSSFFQHPKLKHWGRCMDIATLVYIVFRALTWAGARPSYIHSYVRVTYVRNLQNGLGMIDVVVLFSIATAYMPLTH